jgi:prepilin-type processing-associated H-X9-DG protein
VKPCHLVRGMTALDKVLMCTLLSLLSAIFVPAMFARTIICPMKPPCLSNLKQIAMASFIYMSDYDDRFPHRDRWMNQISPQVKNEAIFHCPELKVSSPGSYGYSFNSGLSETDNVATDDSPDKPYVFESLNLARNASDPFLSFPLDDHRGGPLRRNVAFCDGHAKFVPSDAPLWRAP